METELSRIDQRILRINNLIADLKGEIDRANARKGALIEERDWAERERAEVIASHPSKAP